MKYTLNELVDQETELYVELHRTKAFIAELRQRVGSDVDTIIRFQNSRLVAIRQGIEMLHAEIYDANN